MSNPPSNNPLELSTEEMRALGYQVIDLIVEHFETLREQPVVRPADRPTMESRLRHPAPQEGMDASEVLEQLRRDALENILHVDHPRMFGFVPSPSNFVGVMADALGIGLNIFTGSWIGAPGPAVIELVTINWLREIFTFPETAGGLFVSGGSMANLIGLVVARHVRLADDMTKGVAYYSDQTHAAVPKGLRVLGFRADQSRKLPSDDQYRLDLTTLKNQVAADRADGKKPFCVIANAGTTNTGAVDPLPELADYCREEGLWLHIDGAYGAPAILSEVGSRALRGLDQADSLAFDPHKWLFQPYEIGCVLVRDRNHLRDVFHVTAEYLREAGDPAKEEVSFFDYGIQMTRNARALKLWMSLKVFGLNAFRQAVARGIELAELAEKILRQSPDRWEIVTPAQLGVVTFRYRASGKSEAELETINRHIVARITAEGYALVLSTALKGRDVLRICAINPRTTDDDIRETIRRLEGFGDAIVAEQGRDKASTI